MNRDITGETESLQQSSSSNSLVYLFMFSAAFLVLLPYLFPFTGMLLRSSKWMDVVGKLTSDTFRKSSSFTYTSPPTDARMIKKTFLSESKCESLEALVLDLQTVVQSERQKILKLEKDIRWLQITERLLKERMQKLEDRYSAPRKDFSASYTSPSADFLMRNGPRTESKQGSLDIIVHELSRMVRMERDRMSALEMEVRKLQKFETIFMDRIKKLEENLEKYASAGRQTNVHDSKNEDDFTRI